MKKKEINFLTTSQMLNYAMDIKPKLRTFLEDPNYHDRRPALIAKIKRTLAQHNLIIPQKKEQNGVCKNYEVSEPIAKFVIENILSSYFDRKIEEYERIEAEKQKKNFKHSCQQLNDEQQVLHEIFPPNENNDQNTVEVLGSSLKTMSEYIENFEKEKNFKKLQLLLDDILKIIEKMRKSENQDHNDMSRRLDQPRGQMQTCIKKKAEKYDVGIYPELAGYYNVLKSNIEKANSMFQNEEAASAANYGTEKLPDILSKIDDIMEHMHTASTYKNQILTLSGMIEDYDEYGIHKSFYEYHIKTYCGNPEYEDDVVGVPDSYIEETVCQTMIRALFEKFYDFNEEEFRRDLFRRSMLVIPETPWEYKDGFLELTDRLENPIGNYIFPKNK